MEYSHLRAVPKGIITPFFSSLRSKMIIYTQFRVFCLTNSAVDTFTHSCVSMQNMVCETYATDYSCQRACLVSDQATVFLGHTETDQKSLWS